MKRTALYPVAILLAVAILPLLWRRGAASAQPAAPPHPAQPVAGHWQYASLSARPGGRWVWHSPAGVIVGDRAHVYRELGGREKLDDDVFTVELLNHLGQRGWEMVTVAADEDQPVYWFKQPAGR